MSLALAIVDSISTMSFLAFPSASCSFTENICTNRKAGPADARKD